jgi:hypothetical protein
VGTWVGRRFLSTDANGPGGFGRVGQTGAVHREAFMWDPGFRQRRETTGGGILSASSSLSHPLHPPKRTLGSSSSSSYSPDIHVVEVTCGFPWVLSECWGGTTCRNHQSFAQVLRQRQTPIIMVPPRRPCGWGREGFGCGRFKRRGG